MKHISEFYKTTRGLAVFIAIFVVLAADAQLAVPIMVTFAIASYAFSSRLRPRIDLYMDAITLPDTPTQPRTDKVTEFRLTTFDRCDACGAQAYIAATVNGTELLYCAHHGHKYEAKLRAVATDWHDESVRLLEEKTRVDISA